MRYLGGKAKIAKYLAPVVLQHAQGRQIWEPFVGGANMTAHLQTAIASDAHVPLISMYQAVYADWEPPTELSKEQYDEARKLPDTDPLKAFAGFGCSFSGKWFGGYSGVATYVRRGPTKSTSHMKEGDIFTRRPARGTAQALHKLRTKTPHTRWYVRDFCALEPDPTCPYVIYADPPYTGTTGYGMKFDHNLFWRRCRQWAQHTLVLVSEYACPVPHDLVFEHERSLQTGGNHRGLKRTERLFKVLP